MARQACAVLGCCSSRKWRRRSSPSREESWSGRAPSTQPTRVVRWRSRRMETPRSSAGTPTTRTSGRHGCSRAAEACDAAGEQAGRHGRRRAAMQGVGLRSRPTGTPPSSGGITDNDRTGRMGVHAQRRRVVTAGEQARRYRAVPTTYQGGRQRSRRTQHHHRRRVRRQLEHRRGVVFTRSGGVWTQQGNKLVGTGAVGGALQAQSVAISADGNTAIVGGNADNSNTGAAWVYTRSGGVWTQQGNKLIGTGAVGAGRQGSSVAISADGNTALVGGNGDSSNVGAAWVFTRSGGYGRSRAANSSHGGRRDSVQGSAVAISGDGNTPSSGVWRQLEFRRHLGVHAVRRRVDATGQQARGHGCRGERISGHQGRDLDDGSTVIVAGHHDNSNAGARGSSRLPPALAGCPWRPTTRV